MEGMTEETGQWCGSKTREERTFQEQSTMPNAALESQVK